MTTLRTPLSSLTLMLSLSLLMAPTQAGAEKPRFDFSKIKVQRAKKAAVEPRIRPPSASQARPPKPLSREEKRAFYDHLRKQARASKKRSRAPAKPAAPIVLTPGKPTHGKSMIAMLHWDAAWSPVEGGGWAAGVSWKNKDPISGIYLALMDLEPGRLYALDCAVDDNSLAWMFSGLIGGVRAVQSGHLLAGFFTEKRTGFIRMWPYHKKGSTPGSKAAGFIYSCEISRVK